MPWSAVPCSGAATAHFSFDMTIESFLEGHVQHFRWLGGVPREMVYDNLRSAVARREGAEVTWNSRFLQLRGHYAFHATAAPRQPRARKAQPKQSFATPSEASGRSQGASKT